MTRSSLLHRLHLHKSIPGTGVRLQSNNEPVDAGLISAVDLIFTLFATHNAEGQTILM
jgi:hypothetical protein